MALATSTGTARIRAVPRAIVEAYLSQRGSGAAGGAADTASYFVQEEDGTSKLTLEEGTFFLILEESS